MPLYPRLVEDHHPDRAPVHADHHIVLCGNLEVGGWHRIASGPSEGSWHWGANLTASSAAFGATGSGASVDACKAHIASEFRRMLALAELRERPDAKPGPPRRDLPEPGIEAPEPSRPYDHDADRRLGGMQRNQLHRAVRSGELTVGVLSRSTHGDERWSWSLTGSLQRPDDFAWHGEADTEAEAFEQFERCWAQWLAWAGLEQVGELQRGMKR